MTNLSNSVRGTSGTVVFGSDFIPQKCLWPLCRVILIPVTAERSPVALNVNALNSLQFFFNLTWIFIIGVQEAFKVALYF